MKLGEKEHPMQIPNLSINSSGSYNSN